MQKRYSQREIRDILNLPVLRDVVLDSLVKITISEERKSNISSPKVLLDRFFEFLLDDILDCHFCDVCLFSSFSPLFFSVLSFIHVILSDGTGFSRRVLLGRRWCAEPSSSNFTLTLALLHNHGLVDFAWLASTRLYSQPRAPSAPPRRADCNAKSKRNTGWSQKLRFSFKKNIYVCGFFCFPFSAFSLSNLYPLPNILLCIVSRCCFLFEQRVDSKDIRCSLPCSWIIISHQRISTFRGDFSLVSEHVLSHWCATPLGNEMPKGGESLGRK